jgi:two-component system chemotaxis response regulator CheB
MGKPIRVLVVDDSDLARDLIEQALKRDPDLRVVGMCSNGHEAVAMARSLRPDVITMDVEMPVMGGLEAVERIMASNPTPILVLTADPSGQAAQLTYRALELGALALQIKPSVDADYESWALAREVRLLSTVKVIRHVRQGAPEWGGTRRRRPSTEELPALGAPLEMIAVGCSTGGPLVLQRIFRELPGDFPVPILVVQHINPSFADSLAGWLAHSTRLEVKLAENDDELSPGRVLLAPPGKHLVTPTRGKVALRQGEPRDGHLPSATMLMESVARVYGRNAVGVLLTGMGADGAEGLFAMRRAGARTLAQSRESCVVFGMPGAAVQLNAVDALVHGDEIAQALLRLSRGEPLQPSEPLSG